MDLTKIAQIVAVMLSPTLAIAVALHTPRAVRAVRNALRERAEQLAGPTATAPPIESLAADLRRLLLQHETLKATPDAAMRVKRLVALEAAITDCATEAARALGVPSPQRPARGPLPVTQLRRLLQALVNAGLVLPSGVSLLADGGDLGAARS